MGMGIGIGISGSPGSGKTTAAKMVSELVNRDFFTIGNIFRKIAEERKISIEELSRIAEKDRSMDEEIDGKQLEMLKSGEVVIDSRLSCWLMHKNGIKGVKVWITAPFEVRAKRVAGREKISVKEAEERMRSREESEIKRYGEYYGIDYGDLSIYDLVINNEHLSAEEVATMIVAVVKRREF